ncbi:MAG: DUF1127 domain-containing protein [Paracoccaceae bacterium]
MTTTLLARVRAWIDRRQAAERLLALSPAEREDIGLTLSDLSRLRA